jgi:DNA ligase-1
MTQALLPHLGTLPNMRLFDPAEAAGHVLLFPPNLAKSTALKALNGCRTAMLTGWALERSAKFRYKVDELFPLSDHADYGELLETVASVQPTKVLLVHGYTREFAADLRSRGYAAWSLERPDQLELQLFAPHPAD